MELDEEVMNPVLEMEDPGDLVVEEVEVEVEREDNAMEEEEETSGGGGTGTGTAGTRSSFIQELNLVLILAFLSLSADEQVDDVEEKIKQTTHEYTDSKGKASSVSSSRFRQRRQLNIDGFRHPERQISRSPSKIQDCRHGRRV